LGASSAVETPCEPPGALSVRQDAGGHAVLRATLYFDGASTDRAVRLRSVKNGMGPGDRTGRTDLGTSASTACTRSRTRSRVAAGGVGSRGEDGVVPFVLAVLRIHS
jgi:hypothetical protein